MTPHTFGNLGGIAPVEDKRDFLLGKLQAPTTYPATFIQERAWKLPILYQGKRPACGAHAAVWLKMLLDSYERPDRYYTPRFTWADIKTFDGYPPSGGTDLRSIFKSLQNAGALDFGKLGNDVDLNDSDYAHPTITQPMRDNALPKIIKNYAFDFEPTFDSLKRSLYQNKAVILLMLVGEEFWTAPNGAVSWLEKDILPLRPPSRVVSGHYVVAHSYDENRIYFANSFSSSWGRDGHGYFTRDFIPFINAIGTAVDLPDDAIEQLLLQKSLAEKALELAKRIFALKRASA